MLQPSQLVWIGVALVLLLLGLSLGNVVLLTGAVFVLLTALLATALAPPSGVVVERGLSRATCWVGDTLTVRRELTALGGIGPVFVHDELPPEAEVVDGSNLRVVWKWPGRLAADVSYELRFPKRGRYVLPESRWEAHVTLGVGRVASGVSGNPFEVSVVPRIRNVTRLNEVRAVRRFGRNQGDPAKTGASTDEFKELRPYQPGDPFKRINWKASARRASSNNIPLINELEPETKRAVWIFLDIADYMDVGVPLSNPLESTVEASGTLAQYYLSRGSTLGAYAYNSSGGVGELLTPETGMRQFSRLMGMLAGLKPGPCGTGPAAVRGAVQELPVPHQAGRLRHHAPRRALRASRRKHRGVRAVQDRNRAADLAEVAFAPYQPGADRACGAAGSPNGFAWVGSGAMGNAARRTGAAA